VATEDKATIASSGADYTSLSACEAGEQQDYVTGDKYGTWEITGNFTDTTAVTVDGSTTNSTHWIEIRTTSTTFHGGKWDTGKYLLQVSDANALTMSQEFLVVDGLQVEVTNPSANYRVVAYFQDLASNTRVTMRHCILKATGGSTYRDRAVFHETGSTTRPVYMYNCVVWNVSTTVAHAANSCLYFNGGGGMYIWSCTFSGGYNSAYYVGGTIYAVDNIFVNAANTVAGTWTSPDYNSSDKGTTTGGAHDRTSQTFAFTNAAAGDFHLTALDGGAKGYGVADPGSGEFDDDIDRVARTGTWDIGADQYVAAGGTTILRQMMAHSE
jgi:hypothetical protein